jgi:hypothetical protein
MMASTLALGMMCALGSSVRGQTSTPKVAVVGNDYAFVAMPTTLPAGKTLFSFENRGTVRHEMSMALLKPGVTVEQVLERGPGAASGRLFAERLVGMLIARPGEASDGQLLVDLQPGRRYLVICTLKDTPEAKQHAQMGMVTSFEVP